MKETKWCESCEKNEPVSEEILRTWLVLWVAPRDKRLNVMPGASAKALEKTYVPKDAKFVCGHEGALKLASRWMTTGTLVPQRRSAADAPTLFAEPAAVAAGDSQEDEEETLP